MAATKKGFAEKMAGSVHIMKYIAKQSCEAQSTLEFALVVAAFMAVFVGFSVIWHLFDGGLVLEHALQSASHHLNSVAQGAWLDIFLV